MERGSVGLKKYKRKLQQYQNFLKQICNCCHDIIAKVFLIHFFVVVLGGPPRVLHGISFPLTPGVPPVTFTFCPTHKNQQVEAYLNFQSLSCKILFRYGAIVYFFLLCPPTHTLISLPYFSIQNLHLAALSNTECRPLDPTQMLTPKFLLSLAHHKVLVLVPKLGRTNLGVCHELDRHQKN